MRHTNAYTATLTEDDATDAYLALHAEQRHAETTYSKVINNCTKFAVVGVVYNLMLLKARFFADTSSVFQTNVTAVCDAVSPDHIVPWVGALWLGTALASNIINISINQDILDDNIRDIETKRQKLVADNRKWFAGTAADTPTF